MKKYLLLLGFILTSCSTTTKYSYFASGNEISGNSNVTSNSGITSDISSFVTNSILDESKIEFEIVNEKHVIFKQGKKEIDYFADYIIDGKEFHYNNNLYLNKNRNEIGFLVINGGKLILEETAFLKDGDAYEPRNSIQYGKNALVTVIGQGSNVSLSNCSVNIFSKGSSMIHLMNGASATAKNLDIAVTDEYSCAYSYYNNDSYVNSSNCYVFVDNEKSEESVLFYDE